MKWLLSWIFPGDVRGSRASELREAYQEVRSQSGGLYAWFWLTGQIISITMHAARLAIPAFFVHARRNGMQALRQLRRNTGFSMLNVLGLSLGLGAFLIILLFVHHERSYDTFHSDSDRIYRVNRTVLEGEGGARAHAQTAGALGDHMAATFSEVEAVVRIRAQYDDYFTVDDRTVATRIGFVTDSTFFDVFDFELLRGSGRDVLTSPYSVVLGQNLALSLFGTEDPVGNVVTFGSEAIPLTVTGVVANPPANSHLLFEFLISWGATFQEDRFGNYNNWISTQMGTYVLLQPGAQVAQVEEHFPDVMDRFLADRKNRYAFYLQPLEEVHLSGSQVVASLDTAPGNGRLVDGLLGIGFLLLAIACINFINLATARSTTRAVEVGVRKSIGATRMQLLAQFVGEAIVMSASAMAVAITLCLLFRPMAAGLIGRDLPIPLELVPGVLAICLALVLSSGLAAGLYPAFVLSRFSPAGSLRRQGTSGGSQGVMRRVLVVAQFGTSLVLLVLTLVVYRQMAYMQEKDLGFDMEQLVKTTLSESMQRQIDVVRERLLANPAIVSAAISTGGPSEGAWGYDYRPEGASGEFGELRMLGVDQYWLEAYGIEVQEGLDPRTVFDGETEDVFINETLRDVLLSEWSMPEVIGQRITIGSRNPETRRIVGVVKDFHLRSVNQGIPPLLIFHTASAHLLSVRFATDRTGEALAHMEEVWTTFEDRQPFGYRFVDEAYRAYYQGDKRVMKILATFSAMAVLVALLGLFGLTAYLAERRRKEIGIRKVLGANAGQIVFMLTRSFAIILVIAVVLALPVAYMLAERWLEAYPYRIEAGPGLFAVAIGVLLTVAMGTILYQSARAAASSPTENLTSE